MGSGAATRSRTVVMVGGMAGRPVGSASTSAILPDRSGHTWVVPVSVPCTGLLPGLFADPVRSFWIVSVVSGRNAVPVPGCWCRSPACWYDLPGEGMGVIFCKRLSAAVFCLKLLKIHNHPEHLKTQVFRLFVGGVPANSMI